MRFIHEFDLVGFHVVHDHHLAQWVSLIFDCAKHKCLSSLLSRATWFWVEVSHRHNFAQMSLHISLRSRFTSRSDLTETLAQISLRISLRSRFNHVFPRRAFLIALSSARRFATTSRAQTSSLNVGMARSKFTISPLNLGMTRASSTAPKRVSC